MGLRFEIGAVVWIVTALLAIPSSGAIEAPFTNEWAVKILVEAGEVPDEVANEIAERHHLHNFGKLTHLGDANVYKFICPEQNRRSPEPYKSLDLALKEDKKVGFAEQQVMSEVALMGYSPPTDPEFAQQWNLLNTGQQGSENTGNDMKVERAWIQGYTGCNTTIAVVDTGVDYTHPDLVQKFVPQLAYDYANNDSNPFPDFSFELHGTWVAGTFGMSKDNGVCGVGVAYESSMTAIQLLGISVFELTDILTSMVLGHEQAAVDIYTNSWGPPDTGSLIGGPGTLTNMVLENGVSQGREGKGNIFVFASGNGGLVDDDCNADAYVGSVYTIGIGTAAANGSHPNYGDQCSGKMAVAFVEGISLSSTHVTTTVVGGGCTDEFRMTSSAAPQAAGVIALTLEANPDLTWRDVQYLLVYTSNSDILVGGEFTTNAAGLRFSRRFGFGVIDAEAMVTRARHWISVPPQIQHFPTLATTSGVATASAPLQILFTYNNSIRFLEHVVIREEFTTNGARGDAQVILTSPSGTSSILLNYRPRDFSPGTYDANMYPLMSLQFWGENPTGQWNLTMVYRDRTIGSMLMLNSLSIVLYGTNETPAAVERIPSNCDPMCARGCAAAGPEFCDSCASPLVRDAESLLCVSACESGQTERSGYCYNASLPEPTCDRSTTEIGLCAPTNCSRRCDEMCEGSLPTCFCDRGCVDRLDCCIDARSVCPICSPDQFMCDNGQCIPDIWECDVIVDCADGSDEHGGCPQSCDPFNNFVCPSGECIDLSDVCDGVNNCSGGQDEQFCGNFSISVGFTAPAFTVLERSSVAFLSVSLAEVNGSVPPVIVILNATTPGSENDTAIVSQDYLLPPFGGSITLSRTSPTTSVFISIVNDALVERDEIFTVVLELVSAEVVGAPYNRSNIDQTTISPPSAIVTIRNDDFCSSDQFTCATGVCIPSYFECNDFPDCEDGSDEHQGCTTRPTSVRVGLSNRYMVRESSGQVAINVSILNIDGPLPRDFYVLLRVFTVLEPDSGTATAGEDFIPNSRTIVVNLFGNGTSFIVGIMDDNVIEEDEFFTVMAELVEFGSSADLDGSGSGSSGRFPPTISVLVSPDSAPVLITDDDSSLQLFPFGLSVGDTLLPPADDGTSSPIVLSRGYRFYGEPESLLFVNTNGVLSFREPFTLFSPQPFNSLLHLNVPLIAPFWNDVNTARFGQIFHRETMDTMLLQRAEMMIREYFGGSSPPTRLFIATWDRVAQFGGSPGENTFQVVIASNEAFSFVFFLYGDIEWGRFSNIGFRNDDGSRTFMVPGALTSSTIDIEDTSNVGVDGLYVYRVDRREIIHPGNDTSGSAASGDDSGSGSAASGSGLDVTVRVGLTSASIVTPERFGQVQVSVAILDVIGLLPPDFYVTIRVFTEPNGDTATAGEDYIPYDDIVILSIPDNAIEAAFINITDDNLVEEDEFFTVMVEVVEFGSSSDLDGSGSGGSGAPIIRVIVSPDTARVEIRDNDAPDDIALFPFGLSVGDTLVPTANDGTSSPVDLSPPSYRFYGESENRLYVNTNGVLSFRVPFTNFAPQPFNSIVSTNTPLIVPFWNDVSTAQFGQIFYRETTETILLEVAGLVIGELFEEPSPSAFAPTRLFIATWDRVAEFGGSTGVENTFQVVIASNEVFSFVFFVYGDIEWGRFSNIGFRNDDGSRTFMVPGALTSSTIDIEGTSNVGVDGLYIYRVDRREIIHPGNGTSGSAASGTDSGEDSGSGSTSGSGSGPTSLPVTIGFDQEVVRVSEGDSRVTVSVSVQNGLVTEPLFVAVGTADDRVQNTATAGMDYVPSIVVLQFNQTHTNLSASFDIINDGVNEDPFEEFGISLLIAFPDAIFERDTVIVLIEDEDVLVIGFDPVQYHVIENQNELSLTVRILSGIVGINIDLIVSFENGTAISGEDFQIPEYPENRGIPISFAPGEPIEETVAVRIIDDDVIEFTERFFVHLWRFLAPDSLVAIRPCNATVIIRDEDGPPLGFPIEIGFSETVYTVREDEESVAVTVSVLRGRPDDVVGVVVELTTSDNREGALDYVPVRGNLTFNLDDEYPNRVVQIPIIQDEEEGEVEGDQAFYVRLSFVEVPYGEYLLNPDEARVIIIDLDSPLECSSSSIRLANSTTEEQYVSGRVEVCIDGVWTTVCDDGWDYRDAVTACNQLQVPSYGAIALSGSETGDGSGPIGLTNVQCDQTESALFLCPSDVADDSCGHSQDAGVICFEGVPSCSCSQDIECTVVAKIVDEEQGNLVTLTSNELKCSVRLEEEEVDTFRAATIVDGTFDLDFLSPGSALLLTQLRILNETPEEFSTCELENRLIQHGDPGTVLSELGIEQMSFVYLKEDGSLGSLNLNTSELRQQLLALNTETLADTLGGENACSFQNLAHWLTQQATFPTSRCRLGSSPEDNLIVRFDVPCPDDA